MGLDPKKLGAYQANVKGRLPIDARPGVSKVVIPGTTPSKSNCYRLGRGRDGSPRMYKTPALVAYEEAFYIHCPLRNQKLASYFELRIDVYYPSERSDLDNSLKVVLDCLQSMKAIVNDRKCVYIEARKFKDAAYPRIEFTLTPAQ